ncbi:17925_t:CDS:2 [Entrophospora sp. SA101]|nr:17925_t:CDS:2 [Entrophospora sp. SA101]
MSIILENQLGTKIWDVDGFKDFFGLNNNIIGIDLSSGVAVYALDIQPNDHILDLCCAPGAKLCMISNILAGDNKGFGTITGVDISQNRLSTCRSLIKKHKINRARLFLADGTNFNVYAPCNLKYFKKILNIIEDEKDDDDEKKTKQQSKDDIIKPFYSPKIFRNDQQIKDPRYLYDKVIVDAECTHDGSIVHILKKNLLKNGWELLKPGGILVYSTCSLTRKQNEEIIEWFLLQNKERNAVLEQIPNIENMKTVTPLPITTPTDDDNNRLKNINNIINLSKTVRFDPIHSNTSGFFVARLRKKTVD